MSGAVAIVEKLADKILVGDGCWEWTSYKNNWGYGLVSISNKKYLAHRVVYELMVGPIPEDLEIDHLCRNRACVRPDHLEAVDRKTNQHRGNSPPGINARKTHCSRGHEYVSRVVKGKTWRFCNVCRAEWARRKYAARKRAS